MPPTSRNRREKGGSEWKVSNPQPTMRYRPLPINFAGGAMRCDQESYAVLVRAAHPSKPRRVGQPLPWWRTQETQLSQSPWFLRFGRVLGRIDWCDQDRKSTRLNSSHVRISYAV